MIGGRTLLQRAVERALLIAPADRSWIVGLEADRRELERIVPEVRDRLLLEPLRRDTGLAVATLVSFMRKRHPAETVLAILSADHLVVDHEAFAIAVRRAAEMARTTAGLGRLGAVAHLPSTRFGYIEGADNGSGVFQVSGFSEKPEAAMATTLIAKGALWNMGIFVGQLGAFHQAIEQAAPELAAIAHEAVDAWAGGEMDRMRQIYHQAPKASFDRAILEHQERLFAIPVDCGWSDVGDWAELVRMAGSGADGEGAHTDPLTWTEPGGRPLQVLGVNGVLVCSTPAGSLVATLEAASSVRPPIFQGPSAVPQDAQLIEKPWGAEYIWAVTDRYAAKLLYVRAGEELSLQYHERKTESMWVLSGSGVLVLGSERVALHPGVTITILPETIHRVEAIYDLSIMEVSTPDLDDVVRIEDRYGRAAEAPPTGQLPDDGPPRSV
jgi:mannose-1-phosphate guanylyltransferase